MRRTSGARSLMRDVGRLETSMDAEAPLRSLDGKSYAEPGHCIYCGSQIGLTKEHIVPLGLSGTATIPRASCKSCAKITGKFEQSVLRGPMWAARVFRGLHSRTKHADAPSHHPLRVEKGGEWVTLELPTEEYPILLHFPIFSPPGILHPDGYKSGIRLKGLHSISFGPRLEDVAHSLGATGIELNQKSSPVAFARMLAKIAHAFAFAEGALSRTTGPSSVLPAILGAEDDVGFWVGTLDQPNTPEVGSLHSIRIHDDVEKGMLIAEVRLFSDSSTPSYGVVLGHLR
jgi:hypothetical protein